MILSVYDDLKNLICTCNGQLSNYLYYSILSAINKDYKMMKNTFRFATRKLNDCACGPTRDYITSCKTCVCVANICMVTIK